MNYDSAGCFNNAIFIRGMRPSRQDHKSSWRNRGEVLRHSADLCPHRVEVLRCVSTRRWHLSTVLKNRAETRDFYSADLNPVHGDHLKTQCTRARLTAT